MSEINATAAAPHEENVLKRKSDDVGWEYGSLVDPSNLERVKCMFCNHVSTGEEEGKTARELELRGSVDISRVGDEEVHCVGSSEPHKLGPIDKWTRPIDPKLTQAEALHQQKINKELWKKRTHEVQQYVARWVYNHAIPFNACDNDDFKLMCEAIGRFGPGFEPPSKHELRETLLSEEHARVKSLLQERDAEKMKNGCSIMTDAWSDRKRRSIMNLCTNCADGSSFIRSKEMSAVSHTSEVIFELVDKAIEEIGPEDVVQVVTDNASNNMGAKKLLLEKRPNMFLSSCATHTINLMLQGIGNLPRFMKVLEKAKTLTIFVYGHTRTLNCMRQFTSGKEIIRPGITRFASSYLTSESLLDNKDQLRKMVVDSQWDSLREVKSKKGKTSTATVMSMAFWRDVKLCLNVFEPLVRVLRLVDGDVKPSMGFVYGEIVKAKKQIKETYGNVESRYKDVIDVVEKKMKGRLDSPLHLAAYLLNPYYSYAVGNNIFDDGTITEGFMTCVETFYHGEDSKQDQVVNVELSKFQNREGPFAKKLARTCQNFDYNAASWWRLYGTEVPTLQRMAMRILSLTSSASACERNWSTFENIHTKKRNRLTTERLNDLSFIQFNSRMLSKKQMIKEKRISDVLFSTETTEAQGFLFEGGDDYAVVIYRDEDDEEMDNTTGIPMEVDEHLEPRRSARLRERYEAEEFDSEEEEFDDEEEIPLEDDASDY